MKLLFSIIIVINTAFAACPDFFTSEQRDKTIRDLENRQYILRVLNKKPNDSEYLEELRTVQTKIAELNRCDLFDVDRRCPEKLLNNEKNAEIKKQNAEIEALKIEYKKYESARDAGLMLIVNSTTKEENQKWTKDVLDFEKQMNRLSTRLKKLEQIIEDIKACPVSLIDEIRLVVNQKNATSRKKSSISDIEREAVKVQENTSFEETGTKAVRQ